MMTAVVPLHETVPEEVYRTYTDRQLFHYLYGQRLSQMSKEDIDIMNNVGMGLGWHNFRTRCIPYVRSKPGRWEQFGRWIDEIMSQKMI